MLGKLVFTLHDPASPSTAVPTSTAVSNVLAACCLGLLLQVVLDLGRRPEARFQGATAELLRDEPVSVTADPCQE
jgi:hypothetical protein